MSKHIRFDAADFVEQATHDFDQAMAGLEDLEWKIRDALDDLDRLTA